MKRRVGVAAAAILAVCAIPTVQAATAMNNLGTLAGGMTMTGALTDEAQVVQENFSLASGGNLTAYTTSYGGGSNLDGTMTAAGGFQSALTLYDASGNYVMSQWPMSPVAKTDPTSGIIGDSYLTASNLMAGSYILVLTDWQNQQPATATNLSNGFNGPGGTSFLDVMGNARTANYALNLTVAGTPTATPEPATFWLAVPALLAAAVFGRKRMVKAVRSEA
jgi:hypothetical protein